MNRFDATLWDFLKDETKYEINLKDRFKLLIEILEVLVFIHSNNVSHCDIKPSNIFIRTKVIPNQKIGLIPGAWVLGDFGLSSLLSELSGSSGTPGFASMEQFDGKPSSKMDNYSFAKMAILIMLPWNVAWIFLALPISEADLLKKTWINHILFKSLAELVHIS